MSFRITNNNVDLPLALVGATPLTMTNASGAFSIASYPSSPVSPDGGTTFFVIEMDFIGSGTWIETVTLKTSDPSNQTFTFTVRGFQSQAGGERRRKGSGQGEHAAGDPAAR